VRGEFSGEVRLVLLGIAEERDTGALDTYHGLRGKAQSRAVLTSTVTPKSRFAAVLPAGPAGRPIRRSGGYA
jgi:hypothetical protein